MTAMFFNKFQPKENHLTLATKYLGQQCTNPRCQVSQVTKFCTVVHNNCGSSVWNLLHVTALAHKIFRWLPDFWKIYAPLL
jgi:hypothetical protein